MKLMGMKSDVAFTFTNLMSLETENICEAANKTQ